jgi:hypothetical protein
MGAGRLHNQLEDAVVAARGGIRFSERSQIFTKSLEAGDPGDIVYAMVGFAVIVRAALPALKDAMIAWLKFRSDREIELQAGDYKVRIRGENDVKKAIDALDAIASKTNQEDCDLKKE